MRDEGGARGPCCAAGASQPRPLRGRRPDGGRGGLVGCESRARPYSAVWLRSVQPGAPPSLRPGVTPGLAHPGAGQLALRRRPSPPGAASPRARRLRPLAVRARCLGTLFIIDARSPCRFALSPRPGTCEHEGPRPLEPSHHLNPTSSVSMALGAYGPLQLRQGFRSAGAGGSPRGSGPIRQCASLACLRDPHPPGNPAGP
jgi:hypothetical protein